MTNYRTIWISDTHLGTRYCMAPQLLEFLQRHRAENYYLVGDIVDTWNLDVDWYWDDNHSAIVELLNSYSNVHLIAGNHDTSHLPTFMQKFPKLAPLEAIAYDSLAHGRLLITHGHQFDSSLFKASSDFHFSTAMTITQWCYSKHSNAITKALGWTINRLTEPRMAKFYKNIVDVVDKHYSGIVCGHIHHPRIKRLTPTLTYYNCGDWLSSCSAIVEDFSGEIKLIQ